MDISVPAVLTEIWIKMQEMHQQAFPVLFITLLISHSV